MQVVGLYGPPLIGKGTQSDFLISKGFFHFSAGDYIREQIEKGDPAFVAVAAIMKAGDNIPDEMMIEVVKNLIQEKEQQGFRGVILDGFPRSLTQANALDQMLAADNLPLTVIELYVEDDADGGKTARDKLNDRRLQRIAAYEARGETPRDDDLKEDVFNHRVNVTYPSYAVPVAGHYAAKGQLRRIDGFQPVQTIQKAISGILGLDAPPAFRPPAF